MVLLCGYCVYCIGIEVFYNESPFTVNRSSSCEWTCGWGIRLSVCEGLYNCNFLFNELTFCYSALTAQDVPCFCFHIIMYNWHVAMSLYNIIEEETLCIVNFNKHNTQTDTYVRMHTYIPHAQDVHVQQHYSSSVSCKPYMGMWLSVHTQGTPFQARWEATHFDPEFIDTHIWNKHPSVHFRARLAM